MGGETNEDYGTFQNQRVRENSENGQNGFVESERQPLIDEEASIASEVEFKEPTTSKRWQIIGAILALGSALVYTLYGVLIKKYECNFVDNMFIRSMIQIPLVAILVKLRKKNILLEFPEQATRKDKMKKYAILIGSGLLIGFNEHIAYLGVLYIPLGTAMTIIYSAPIFTMIFSFVFLRIKQGLYKIFFALILIVGVLLVIRPPFIFHNLKPNVESYSISNQTVTNNQTSPAKDHSETKDNIYWIGVAICVVAAACTGLISVVFNYLQDVDTGVAVFWSGCMTILCSFAFLSIDHDSHIFFTGNLNWTYMGELFALGSLGICAVWMVTTSCQLLDPTINSVLRAQQVIFAFVAQTIVSQVLPYYLTFIGAGFVVLSAVCMPLEKYVKPKIPEKLRRFI